MKYLITALLILSTIFTFSQDEKKLSFGIIAGYNYNSNGEYVTRGTATEIARQFEADKKSGYHGGLYFQYTFNSMYLRPEVLYTKTKSEYADSDFDQTKIEVPILVGFDIIKPVSIFIGPSFHYILENEFEGFDVKDIDIESDLSVGFQVGLALKLHSQITVDLRYEKGLADNILTIKDDTNTVLSTLETRPEQLILSISLKL